MIEKLSMLELKNSVDNTVPSLALRTVLISLPRPVPGVATTPQVQESYSAVSRVLIPRLIGPGPKTKVPQTGSIKLPQVPEGILQNDGGLKAESVDILIEVVRCFGPLLEQVEVEAMQETVLQILENDKATAVVKKRAVVAISMLAVYLSEDHLRDIVQRIIDRLSRKELSPVMRRLYISILGSMARSIPVRFGPHISKATPLVIDALSDSELQVHLEALSDGDDLGQDFNEVREAALVALEAFLASCPQETKPFTDDMIAACLRYLKYDPNYAVDDDEDMDVDDGNGDEDEDDEFEDDDGFEDDDDDASWKVRRCAAKALYTFISTRGSGDLLENGVLYNQAAPHLIKRIDEREENVRLEVISALALLVRKTGEGLHTSELSLDDNEPEVTTQMPISRKRRRQSSGGGWSSQSLAVPGVVSPTLDKTPKTGPQADLARLTPTIIKASVRQLKGKSVATKQAVVNLLDDMVSVQRGGLSDYLGDIIGPVIDAITSTGTGAAASSLGAAGGSTSATPSTLKIAALKLVSDIAKTHPSASLQPYISKVVAGVTSAVHDRFYRISSEALRTVEELVKVMTPPRAKNTGAMHQAELNKLFEIIMDRSSANEVDAEVRQRAIHALGPLISRTSSAEATTLLPAGGREIALNILRERLKNEITRLAAVRAVDHVAAAANSPEQLGKDWVQDVALELAGQLRKANRSLRGSSVMALRHLVLSPATKDNLEPETVQGVVSALMPAIKNSDTHLLGPSLVILAHLVQHYAELVMTEEMTATLCELLKTPFAGIVLDPLVDLIVNIGKSGAGGDLMKGLLKDVSISGDPAVVGKVMGTLLVTSGVSTGVSTDSFVAELHHSAQAGDEARVSLALAVLGEAGKGLGTQSPVKPELFLEQFHDEPDKVSLSAALALGRAGSGNIEVFLPVILDTMKRGGNTQYLLVQSIKEILHSISTMSELGSYAPSIWEKLRQAAEEADNKVVCAECAGRLVILNPAQFMPHLQVSIVTMSGHDNAHLTNKIQTLLSEPSPAIRGMALQAIRYSLPESDETFDAMLRNVLVDMLLTMLQDKDMETRRLAMTTLNSATRNKPDLIIPHLGQLVPFVLHESVIKPELVKELKLGPFTHTVDEGLEVRKVRLGDVPTLEGPSVEWWC
jgi:cullin-associated NEDD8-dissociated protein 1